MDKYEFETPGLKTRASKNADLYKQNEIEDYNKIDLNSNVSVLKTDARDIDVDKIREMLDKKYRDNLPKRKSIDIAMDNEKLPSLKADTKEYDINEILARAKSEAPVDYQKERLKKVRDTNYNILDNLDLTGEKEEGAPALEQELMSLINTITELELKNKDGADIDDLLDLTDENETASEATSQQTLENSFYTGNLAVKKEDYDDFNDIQDDIKSNSILIKVLVLVFIIIILGIAVFFLNKYLNWGLF